MVDLQWLLVDLVDRMEELECTEVRSYMYTQLDNLLVNRLISDM